MTLPSRRSLILGAGAAFITRGAQAYPPSMRNVLIFPGGRPGFNPTHIASKNAIFSGVAAGTNVIDILSGLAGTVTGAITSNIDSIIGPNTSIAQQTNEHILFPVAQSQIDTSGTMAVIGTDLNIGAIAFSFPFSVGSASSGPGVLINSTGAVNWNNWNGSNPTASVTISLTSPYFIAMSMNTITCNILALNLHNGQILTGTSASVSQDTHNTNIVWGDSNALNQINGSFIAAAMYSTSYLTLPQLITWAQAPWDFWYPQSVRNTIISSLGKGSVTSSHGVLLLVGH